jgi:hypothetical protein
MPYPYFISIGGFGLRQALTTGCLVVLLLLAAAAGGLLLLVFQMGVFENHTRQSVLLPSDSPPALVIKLDPQHPNARPFFAHLLKNSSEPWRNFLLGSLPWEATWTLSPNADNTAVDSTVALSLPRLSGLVEGRADPDLWRWFPGQKVTSLSFEQPGLWVARSALPCSGGPWHVLELPGSGFPLGLDQAKDPLPIPESLPCVLVIDNRNDLAFKALVSLLYPPRQPGDDLTWEPPVLDAEGWIPYFGFFSQATATAQFNDEALLVIDVRIETTSPEAARVLLALADRQRDRISKKIEAAGGWLDGAWTINAQTITGVFSISNAYETIPALLRGDKP